MKTEKFCKICKHYLGIEDSEHKCNVNKPTEGKFTCEELCREDCCYYYEPVVE